MSTSWTPAFIIFKFLGVFFSVKLNITFSVTFLAFVYSELSSIVSSQNKAKRGRVWWFLSPNDR